LNLQSYSPPKRWTIDNSFHPELALSKASFSWLCLQDPKHAVQAGCFGTLNWTAIVLGFDFVLR
jgi:hypothetical protein